MELIYTLEFSLTTLMIVSVMPFLYFGYQTKYWYRADILKRLDFLLQLVVVLLSVVVLIKMAGAYTAGREAVQLTLLHLAPLVLTLLIVSKKITRGVVPANVSAKPEGNTGYRPMPVGREVQLISWDEIIINEELKYELQSVMEMLKDPRQAHHYGIDLPKGILLYGPPGTGKTTIARAIASTANLSFFVLKMDEVVSKWVGESEKNLTILFNAALKYAPSVIFIDEVDSIGKQRSGSGAQYADNLLNHLLQLIDGVVKAEGLYIIAATNRADLVDDALKRAGRLNKVIEIPLPDLDNRAALFNISLSKIPLEEGIDLYTLAEFTDGCSGADIKEICNQAGLNAFKRESGGEKRSYSVTEQDLQSALYEFVG